MLNERKLSKAEEKRKEEIVKDLKSNKREFVKRYGKDAESVMYGTAVKRAKKQVEEMNQNKIKEAVKAALMKKESVQERDEYFEPEDYADLVALQDATAMMDAIEDLYKKAKALGYGPDVKKLVADLDEELKNPKKADLNKDGELSSYEEKRGAAIEKAMSEKNLKEINREPVKVGDRVGNTVQGFDFIVKAILDDYLVVQDLNTRTLKKTFIDNMYKYQSPVKEIDTDKGRGTVVLSKTSNPTDIKKLTDQGLDVELKNEILSSISSNSDYSEYSNDALTDMIVNLSRYEDTEDLVKRVKDELENRRKKAKGEMKEDIDLGHEDNEPHMIKAELYRIGKYAMELYQMVDQFEGMGEVDFPAWWQAMITDSASKMVKAKHYLDFEVKEPAIDAAVNAMTDVSEPGIEEGLPKGYWAKKIPGGKMDESNVNESFLAATSKRVIKDENLDSFISQMEDAGYKLVKILGPKDNLYKDHPTIDHTWTYGLPKFNGIIGPMKDGDRFRYEDQETYNKMSLEESYEALVKKLKGQGKSEKAAKAIAGAVASYKAKGGGKGPTAKQKK